MTGRRLFVRSRKRRQILAACVMVSLLWLTGQTGSAAMMRAAPPNPTARTALSRWLRDVRIQTSACVQGYSAMEAQLAAATGGAGDMTAIDRAAKQERRACQYVVIARLPAQLARDATPRAADAAITRSTAAAWTVAADLQDIAEGNTNASEVRQTLTLLHDAVTDYKAYMRFVAILKRAYRLR